MRVLACTLWVFKCERRQWNEDTRKKHITEISCAHVDASHEYKMPTREQKDSVIQKIIHRHRTDLYDGGQLQSPPLCGQMAPRNAQDISWNIVFQENQFSTTFT